MVVVDDASISVTPAVIIVESATDASTVVWSIVLIAMAAPMAAVALLLCADLPSATETATPPASEVIVRESIAFV